MDFIDIENPDDHNDPSTSEEYWNYIAYKEIANELAEDLHNWLDHGSTDPNAPTDPTWSPLYATYKSNYPGIDLSKVGQETGPNPISIPDVDVPVEQSFRIISISQTAQNQPNSITVSSEPEFKYQLQTSTTLNNDWVDVGSPVTATSTTTTFTHSAPNGDPRRFYRVILLR